MPRAVSPWTWAKALRDHGPNDRDFLCALLILRTFMNNDGFAFPSLRTWAGAARTDRGLKPILAVNTLRSILDKATAEGWLHVDRRPGPANKPRTFSTARNIYRCTIPDHIVVSEKDEEIADALVAINGDVQRTSSGQRLTESLTERTSVSSHADTAVSPMADTDAGTMAGAMPGNGVRHAHDAQSVSNDPPICIKSPSNLYQTGGQSVSAMGDTEVLKKFPERSLYEGAGASARTSPQEIHAREDRDRAKESERIRDRIERIHLEYILANDDHLIVTPEVLPELAKATRCTEEQASQAIEHLTAAGRLPIKRQLRRPLVV